MKKLFWLVLCSFLVLGACSQSDHDSKQDEKKSTQKDKKDSKSSNDDTVKKVKDSAKKKDNPKSQDYKGNKERVDGDKAN